MSRHPEYIKRTELVPCQICGGLGHDDYYVSCPRCGGTGYKAPGSRRQIKGLYTWPQGMIEDDNDNG
jgi:RecJ-like exonuclease